MSLDSATLAELDPLTLAELDLLYLGDSPTLTDAELLSLLQFNIRAFTRILPSDVVTIGQQKHLLGLYEVPESDEVGNAIGGYGRTYSRLGGTAYIQPLLTHMSKARSRLGGAASNR
jgi:hypothetical protein